MLQHHPSNIRIRHVERRCANWIRLQELFSHRKSPVSACGNACESCTEWVHTCQLSRFSQEFPSFLLNLPVSQNAFWVIFGDYSWTLSLITFPHMQRFLGVSRFLYSGGWHAGMWMECDNLYFTDCRSGVCRQFFKIFVYVFGTFIISLKKRNMWGTDVSIDPFSSCTVLMKCCFSNTMWLDML